MPFIRTLVLLAALAAPQAVCAQGRPDTVLDRAIAAAATGPRVLQHDGNQSRLGGPRVALGGDPAIVEAVPVPNVMNGGGFGYTGFDYYSDAATEGRLGQRRRVNEIILAPTLRAPPR